MKFKIVTASIISFYFTTALYAQDNNTCQIAKPEIIKELSSKLTPFFKIAKQAMHLSHTPGMAITIVYRDKVIATKGFGIKNITEPTSLVDSKTVFQIASLSKPFTSSIIARQVSLGKVSWDTKIKKLDSDFKIANLETMKKLTIGDLLSHQSSLPGHAGDLLEDLGYSRDEVLHRLRYITNLGKYRYDYAYTNFGFSEAAFSIAKSMNLSWLQLSNQFFKQLDMPNSSYSNEQLLLKTNRSYLHKIISQVPILNKQGRNADAQSPAGGLSTNAKDYANYLMMLVNHGCFKGKQLITTKVLTQSQINQQVRHDSKISYGYGWNVSYDDKHIVSRISHSGAFAMGTRAYVLYLPKRDLAIAIFSNAAWSGLPELLGRVFFQMISGKNINNWPLMLTKINKQFSDEFNIWHKIPVGRQPQPQSLSKYIGEFSNKYYGNIKISETRNCQAKLSKCLKATIEVLAKPVDFKLIYFNPNTFYFKTIGENASGYTSLRYKSNSKYKTSAIIIKAFNELGKGVFIKK